MLKIDPQAVEPPEVYVTNFHKRMTGVSATADAVVSAQQSKLNLRLVGNSLPNAPPPCSYRQALKLCRRRPTGRPFAIWHVRRNLEMSAALIARDLFRLPVRIVFTSAAQRLHSRVPRSLIRRMDAVVATTPKAGTFVPHLAEVIPHGVDIQRFSPSTDRGDAWSKLGHGGRYGIGIFGRVRPEKGTDHFVRAMCDVLPKHKDFTAVIVGRTTSQYATFESELRQQIDRCGLSDRILFIGEQPRDVVPSLMRALSMVVAPARYEGFGMTPLESLASGVAVVATDTGVYREVIAEGETGHVVDIDDVDALTRSIEGMLKDPQRLHAMGQAGRAFAQQRLSLGNEIDGYLKVYDRLWSGEKF